MLIDTNQRTTTVRKQDIKEISVDCWKNSENKLKIINSILETKTVTPIPSTQIATSTIITTTTETVTEPKGSQKLFIHPVRHVEGQTIPQRHATMEPMQSIDRLPGKEDRKHKIRSKKANHNDSNDTTPAATQNLNWKCHVATPELRLTDRR